MKARLSAGRLVGITAGVMVIGLVGGAAVAAPDQLLPLAQFAGESVISNTGPLLAHGAHEVESAAARVIAFIDHSSPRTIGMVLAGAIAVLLATTAGVMSWRSRSAEPVARPATISSALQVSHRRAGGTRATPKQVHALAAKGSTLAEIARGTGLPMDAVALLLAVGGASGTAMRVAPDR